MAWVVEVFADVVPEVEHYFVLEFSFVNISFDEEFSHLLVFAVCGIDDALVYHFEEFDPRVFLASNFDCEL